MGLKDFLRCVFMLDWLTGKHGYEESPWSNESREDHSYADSGHCVYPGHNGCVEYEQNDNIDLDTGNGSNCCECDFSSIDCGLLDDYNDLDSGIFGGL